jgi:hypothetical protein
VWAIDASGDLVRRIAAIIPAAQRRSVSILDMTAVPAIDSIDVLALDKDAVKSRQLTSSVHDGLVADLPAEFHGPVGRQSLKALLVAMSHAGMNLEDLPLLIENPGDLGVLADLVAGLDDPAERQLAGVLRRIHQGQPDNRAEFVRWLLSKTPAITSRPTIFTIGAKHPTRQLSDLVAPGSIVLVKPPQDVEGSRLVTSVLLQLLADVTCDRTLSDLPIAVYLDEVQRCAGAVLRQLMNESRKRGICLHVATQHLQNLEAEAEAVLTNSATVLTGRVLGPQVNRIERDLDLPPGTVARLPNLQFCGRVQQGGAALGPVELSVAPQKAGPAAWPSWATSREAPSERTLASRTAASPGTPIHSSRRQQ